jgi:antirestriction protein ArdC
MNHTEHPIPYFLTFKQVQEAGGRVKKGAKSEMVVFFNMIFKDKDNNTISKETALAMGRNNDVKPIRFIKYFHVFNVRDIDGITFTYPEVELNNNQRIEKCEAVINTMPNPPEFIENDANRAYYNSVHDYFNLPDIRQFETPEDYYSTLFHELSHSTGHQKRLNRATVTNPNHFGSKEYALEELIAEISAAYICASIGIDANPIMENSAAYIQNWLKVLREDKMFIFKATAGAQKSADYILGKYSTFKSQD